MHEQDSPQAGPTMPSAPTPIALPAPSPQGSGAVEASVMLWRALAALGMRHVAISPGSRSAPLVYALGARDLREQITAHVRIDERAAAFTALGFSRHAPQSPGAVVTTSGTATAHLLAAVMEAHHTRIPLFVLTADRPAELRGTGANQTTHQTELYAPFVRMRADVPAPGADGASRVELRTIANLVARAYAAATGVNPGPVHLNLGFRDPLVPHSGRVEEGETSREQIVLSRTPVPAAPLPIEIAVDERTVVVAGDANAATGQAAAAFAATQMLPLLAEPSSSARHGSTFVPGYPALLRSLMQGDHAARPHRVVIFGHPTLSRPVLRDLLSAEDVELIVVDPDGAQTGRWNDHTRRAALVVPGVTAAAPNPQERERRQQNVQQWQREAANSATTAPLPWQVRAVLAVWETSGPEDLLVLGSSSLVRDLEQHAGGSRTQVVANRGLAGIDGTTAMAGGLALARAASGQAGRVRVLVGDLTALHDLTGLLIGPEEQQPDLDLIVVDDDGGRIFSGLEHAAAPPEFLRRFFTTPHGADITAAAAALGASAQRVSVEGLPALLAEQPTGVRVLVVQEQSNGSPDGESPTVESTAGESTVVESPAVEELDVQEESSAYAPSFRASEVK